MAEEPEEESVSEEQVEETTTTKIRFILPQRLDFMTFVGRDVFAIAHDIYIVFFHLKTHCETVYVANNEHVGDGVDCITGYRSNVFAFAEKVNNPRIFIVSYPSLIAISELKDSEVNRYKALCMMEGDLIMGFSGFPNYMASLWSWRTKQKLLSVETGIIRRRQIYMASRSHMMVCECWGEGLYVWEASPCYRQCLMMRRKLSDPPEHLYDLCWTADGQLYVIDIKANLYNLLSDGIGMVSSLEWSEEVEGERKPRICSFGNGVIIYCPNGEFKALKKTEQKWKVVWTWLAPDNVRRIVSNTTSDVAIVWTEKGYVYKFSGESEEKIRVKLFTYKQRNIIRVQILAPDNTHIVTLDKCGVMCLYNILTGKLVEMKYVEGNNVLIESSPVDPIVIVFGEINQKYGMVLLERTVDGFNPGTMVALTHQIVSRIVFSPTGRQVMAAAMSAGHIFIYKLSKEYELTLVRYAELGRGLADCTLAKVGDDMRAFSLVLFSDKYAIGERIICINAETGKDNKFAGKMQGPYSQLVPLSLSGFMIAVPHQSTQFHMLRLTSDKGVTVSVKISGVVDSGHDLKYYSGMFSDGGLVTYGFDGTLILRRPEGTPEYDLKLVTSHRYEQGLRFAMADSCTRFVLSLANNGTVAVHFLDSRDIDIKVDIVHSEIKASVLDEENRFAILTLQENTYLELQEEKKIKEEAMDYKKQREEVVKNFEIIREKLVELLEENIRERPLHQLSLAEFNLHLEAKKERLKQAEREREEIRLSTEELIRAQDRVTAWIKKNCWDVMLTPRIKLFAIFSHYQVENYAVLPTQRDKWPELNQIAMLRGMEMENDEDVFRPWEEIIPHTSKSQITLVPSNVTMKSKTSMVMSEMGMGNTNIDQTSSENMADQYILSGTNSHNFIEIPKFMIPQTLAYTYLQMNWLQHIIKLNVQNMRLWFNKQFDDMMNQKKREVGLVMDRNARLRFIVSELNKLSDLRGSFHHLIIAIKDPQWRQEEVPLTLIKVDPEECSITPYISPSQVVIPPVDPGPKDDFKERALMDMMDGVLEKLWHEEIKKPVPLPQCMIEKDPEHFNEDDLRHVFDYEAKVEFRNQERDKYRKMLHAEYAKITALLNEGVVKFNQKVKEMWLTKLRVDSVIGQENLNLMRMRRVNLDRLEDAEKLEDMRSQIIQYEKEVDDLSEELALIEAEAEECQSVYDALALKDKNMDRSFRNYFADLSPIIVDQCYKFFKKRPKWHQRATMTSVILYELATAIGTGVKPPMLHVDCVDYFKGLEALDQPTNMPPVMDDALWASTCKLRRSKIENEVKMRAVVQDMAGADSSSAIWNRAINARRAALQRLRAEVDAHRDRVEFIARNKTIQLVIPAGQVEIVTTGRVEDFQDATLILRSDVEAVNNVILKVGELKLRMMKKQMEFRRGILSKEWEHAQMKMKLRHMEQELYSYQRLKIPKELQLYLKNKEQGYTEEREYLRMEKENEATMTSISKILNDMIQRCEELEVRTSAVNAEAASMEKHITSLNVQVSEKRLNEDPLEPIRIRRIFKKRMDTLVERGRLIRQVQAQHTKIVLLQTELELLRLKTYPTLASFRTYC